MPSRALGPSSEHCVFVFLHQTRDDTIEDYERTVTEFLPQVFDHPIFLFLRPDGTEIDEGLRSEHRAMSGSQIAKVLKKHVWPETGEGLTPRQWKKAEEAYAEAAALVDEPEDLTADAAKKARRLLAGVLRLKPDCGVKDRARLLLEDLDARESLDGAWMALDSGPAKPPEPSVFIHRGDYAGMRKYLGGGCEIRGQIDQAIRARFAVTEVRHQLVILDETSVHHYLEATFSCGMAKADDLRAEVSILTQDGKVLDGNARIEGARRSSRLMVAATITPRALGGELIRALRVRLFLGDLLVAERIEDGGPETWPAVTEKYRGPDFYEPGKAWHQSGGLRIDEIRVGRVR